MNTNSINAFIQSQDWNEIESSVNQLQDNFATKLRHDYPQLSRNDIQIILLIRLGFKHSEIAGILNILMSSFRMRRTRLKKKMNINCDSFSNFIRTLYSD